VSTGISVVVVALLFAPGVASASEEFAFEGGFGGKHHSLQLPGAPLFQQQRVGKDSQ